MSSARKKRGPHRLALDAIHRANSVADKKALLSQFCHYPDVRSLPPRPPSVAFEKCRVQVLELDTLEAAKQLVLDSKCNPLVLNMASNIKPGGGWMGGAKAQEESLFYRTTYCLSLRTDNPHYPLLPRACIYSPRVRCFLPKTPEFDCAFLAIAAVRNPTLTKDGTDYASRQQEELMRRKLRGILDVAALHGHDSLVLGAFGCGVFGNPGRRVAQLFAEVIRAEPWPFTRIVFAILDDAKHYNFIRFQQELGHLQ